MMPSCEKCGSEFVLVVPTKIYCSEKCRKLAEKRRARNRRHGQNVKVRSCLICGDCVDPFRTKFCSARCYHNSRLLHFESTKQSVKHKAIESTFVLKELGLYYCAYCEKIKQIDTVCVKSGQRSQNIAERRYYNRMVWKKIMDLSSMNENIMKSLDKEGDVAMETIQPGKLGAQRQSWRSNNPREMLYKAVIENPNSTEEELSEELWHKTSNKLAIMRVYFDYWFANNYRSLVNLKNGKETKKQQIEESKLLRARLAAESKNIVSAAIKNKASIYLMKMILPNGKELGDTLGAELKTIAPHIGDWLVRVSKLVENEKMVRECVSEKRLKIMYES